MKKKSEHADKTIRHRSTFAILFYINRTKMRKDGTCWKSHSTLTLLAKQNSPLWP